MSSLVDRLRGALSPGRLQPPTADGTGPGGTASGVPGSAQPYAPAGTVRATLDPAAVAEALGGEWRDARPHPWLVVERKYAAGYRHGRIATCDSMPPESGVWPGLSVLTGGQPLTEAAGRLLFLDLETTGLAGGAGTYAFLVGLGWFEGATFRIRQYFLSAFGAERALLEEVATLVADCAGLVTFNGRTFDVPLIETRFALHRLRPPFGELPHVDMLHAARRLWRPPADGDYDYEAPGLAEREREAPRGCRLSELEQVICGHEREGDVPGFEIPGRYFNFVRSGDARPLEPVLEHNRLDLLSLAHLTARAAQLAVEGPSAATDAREALGIGALYERAGRLSDARAAYARAAGLSDGSAGQDRALAGDFTTRAEALRAFALLARRERKYDAAADAWTRALGLRRCPPPIAREAAEALAVHHEHRLRDLEQARHFALQSLQYRGTASRKVAVQHRLKRLDRKLGRPDALDFQ